MSATQNALERRIQPRTRVQCSGRIELESGELLPVLCVDVSPTGLRIVSRIHPAEAIAVGSRVHVRVMLKERFVVLPATVAWSRESADLWSAGIRVVAKDGDHATRRGWDELTGERRLV